MATNLRTGDAQPERLLSRLRKHPVALFVFITFVVSHGVGMPMLMLVGTMGRGLDPLAQLYVGRFFVVIGPTCGALAAVAATQGHTGWREFFRDRLSVRSPALWIAAAMPLVMLLAALIAYAAIGSPLGSLRDALARAWPLLLVHIVLQTLVIGLGEEIGWRGWLLPTLKERHGLARATLITGVIWYFWHFPILLGGTEVALWFAVAVAGISTLLSLLWLCSRGSIIPAAIAHGSVNAPFFFFDAALPAIDDQSAWQAMGGLLTIMAAGALLLHRAKAKALSA